jgi:TrwC relaxase
MLAWERHERDGSWWAWVSWVHESGGCRDHKVVLVRAGVDGKWRAPDSYRYGEHVGAAAQMLLAVLESRMTRRWGLKWVRRADGYGFEIKGISQELMEEFSSRRKTISAHVAEAACGLGRAAAGGTLLAPRPSPCLLARAGSRARLKVGRARA